MKRLTDEELAALQAAITQRAQAWPVGCCGYLDGQARTSSVTCLREQPLAALVEHG